MKVKSAVLAKRLAPSKQSTSITSEIITQHKNFHVPLEGTP